MRGCKATWLSNVTLLIALMMGQIAGTNAQAASSEESPASQWRKGLVRWDDQWLTPEEVAKVGSTHNTLDQYRAKREAAPRTVEGQLRLANWCLQHQLAEQERAHLIQVLEIESTHAEARRRLGFVLVDGAWMSRDEIRRSQQRAKQAVVAVDRWSRQLKSIAAGLTGESERKQTASKAKLMEIKEASAVPAMELALAGAGDSAALVLIDALSAMPAPEASVALTRLAMYSPSTTIRKTATAQLKTRPQEHFIPLLLAELSTPMQTKVTLFCAPDGRLTYRHWFYAEGSESRKLAAVDQTFRSQLGGAINNAAELARQEAALALAATEQSLVTEEQNESICKLLAKITGLNLPAKADVWWSWWNDKTETYLAEEKPLYQQYVQREYVVDDVPRYYGATGTVRRPAPTSSQLPSQPPRMARTHECLIAGTPVWTITGPVAVEKMQIGDLVLAQDVESGELAYKPVLQTTTRPAVPLVKFQLPNDTITCSGGHLFWSEGKGWLRARQIEPGVSLHLIADNHDVQSAEETKAEKTYNLIVADFHTYFVGNSKLLSHDNTPRRAMATARLGEAPPIAIAVKAK